MAGPVPGVIVNVRSLVRVTAPVALPVTVTIYVPAASVLVPLSVTVTLLPGVTGFVEKPTVVPTGFPVAESVIGFVNPPIEVVPSTICILAPAGQEEVAGAGDVKSNPEGGGVRLKLSFEISKKIFPIASIFTRAVLVATAGMDTASDPSLGVLADNTVG